MSNMNKELSELFCAVDGELNPYPEKNIDCEKKEKKEKKMKIIIEGASKEITDFMQGIQGQKSDKPTAPTTAQALPNLAHTHTTLPPAPRISCALHPLGI
jgi:hypothetical protein